MHESVKLWISKLIQNSGQDCWLSQTQTFIMLYARNSEMHGYCHIAYLRPSIHKLLIFMLKAWGAALSVTDKVSYI